MTDNGKAPLVSLLHRHFAAASRIAEHPSCTEDRESSAISQDPLALAAWSLLSQKAALLARWHLQIIQDDVSDLSQNQKLLLRSRLEDVATLATSKFYAYRYDQVPWYWRSLYTEAMALLSSLDLLEGLVFPSGQPPQEIQRVALRHESILDSAIEVLDRALITTGGLSQRLGAQWIEETLRLWQVVWEDAYQRPDNRSARRPAFPTHVSSKSDPKLQPAHTCPRHEGWSFADFETYMLRQEPDPEPVIFTDLIQHWPAVASTERCWRYPDTLLSKTTGGKRLVPIEVGRSYVDDGWGQEILRFDVFLRRHVIHPLFDEADCQTLLGPCPGRREEEDSDPPAGYLAQHDLFKQIPSLRQDVSIPDFCWAEVPPHPHDASKNQPPLETPQLNAWFGPPGTITPLHTDGYHNLLCQVVGAKYVRLYPPDASPQAMRPRGAEGGVDMSNTSALDVGVLEGWDEKPDWMSDEHLADMRKGLEGVEYRECILRESETLLIPIGWWHYVRSLSVSFSVSFWWN